MQYTQATNVNLTTSWTEVDPNFIIEYSSIYIISGLVEAQLYNQTGWFKLESGSAGDVIKYIESAKRLRVRASSGVATINYYVKGNPFLIGTHENIDNPDDDDFVLLEDISDSKKTKKVTVGNLVHKVDREVTALTTDTILTTTYILDNYFTVEPITVDITITLPDVTTVRGKIYSFKHIGATSKKVTIDCYGSDEIDGETSQDMRIEDNLVVISDGTNWRII